MWSESICDTKFSLFLEDSSKVIAFVIFTKFMLELATLFVLNIDESTFITMWLWLKVYRTHLNLISKFKCAVLFHDKEIFVGSYINICSDKLNYFQNISQHLQFHKCFG